MKEITVNLASLEAPYGALRGIHPRRERRMLVSVEAGGLHRPVVVVPSARAGHYVLVDGHKRLRALRKLKADVAPAVAWDLPPAEALARAYRAQDEDAWNAVEEGALVEELHRGAHWTLKTIADALERTVGWVSRRLGLVQDLAGPILDSLQRGKIGVHSAVTCLLPLSRDNKPLAERLAQRLAEGAFTTRQIQRLYDHCRRGPPEVANQIAADPATFLKSLSASCAGMDLSLTVAENNCLDQLRLIGNVSLALARRLPEVWAEPAPTLDDTFHVTRDRFTLLEKTLAPFLLPREAPRA